MAHSLIWLPSVLTSAGLKVARVGDWENRGRGDVGPTFGVICHHTAGGRNGNMPSLQILIDGRSDLPGPLAQLGLGRDGTFYVIAAGRCNHAGSGSWQNLVNGNSNFIGIEAENTGLGNDFPWPSVQIDAYQRGVAAILNHVGRPADFCAGHKEYALPAGRKSDPTLDMNAFRTAVRAIMQGTASPPILIPPAEPPSPDGTPGRPTLRRGANEELVRTIQKKLGITVDGDFGAKTEAAVREFQRSLGLVADGIVGPKTWLALDK
jgi:peptidoglycan hydrolase-like protein with peptidoglycan-binding domain